MMATDVMTTRVRRESLARLSPAVDEVHAGQRLCCFCTDADGRVGWGHLRRCLAIADALPRDIEPVFALGPYSMDAAEKLSAGGRRAFAGDDPLRAISDRAGAAPAVVVADPAHPPWLSQPDRLRRRLENLRAHGTRIALIDGLAPLDLCITGGWPLALYISPYCGADAPPDMPAVRTLCGPAYAVVPRQQPRMANSEGPLRLLVTLGGADPNATTLKALDALDTLESHDLSVRVILGPSFCPALRLRIREATARRDAIALIDAPDGLAPHFAWAELVLAGAGLTKYELAAWGLPSVLIAPDAAAVTANAAFAAEGTAIHLGADAAVTPAMIGRAVATLMGDPGLRRDLAHRGQALVDGQGAARIAKALEGLVNG